MDSYFVSLDAVDCANRIREAVFDSVTGEEIDAYAITHPSGGRCHPGRLHGQNPGSLRQRRRGRGPVPLRLGRGGVL